MGCLGSKSISKKRGTSSALQCIVRPLIRVGSTHAGPTPTWERVYCVPGGRWCTFPVDSYPLHWANGVSNCTKTRGRPHAKSVWAPPSLCLGPWRMLTLYRGYGSSTHDIGNHILCTIRIAYNIYHKIQGNGVHTCFAWGPAPLCLVTNVLHGMSGTEDLAPWYRGYGCI